LRSSLKATYFHGSLQRYQMFNFNGLHFLLLSPTFVPSIAPCLSTQSQRSLNTVSTSARGEVLGWSHIKRVAKNLNTLLSHGFAFSSLLGVGHSNAKYIRCPSLHRSYTGSTSVMFAATRSSSQSSGSSVHTLDNSLPYAFMRHVARRAQSSMLDSRVKMKLRRMRR
jgi:hypothetical protein